MSVHKSQNWTWHLIIHSYCAPHTHTSCHRSDVSHYYHEHKFSQNSIPYATLLTQNTTCTTDYNFCLKNSSNLVVVLLGLQVKWQSRSSYVDNNFPGNIKLIPPTVTAMYSSNKTADVSCIQSYGHKVHFCTLVCKTNTCYMTKTEFLKYKQHGSITTYSYIQYKSCVHFPAIHPLSLCLSSC